MIRPYERTLPELQDAYRNYLLSKVSKVRILGEAEDRTLKDVFVELSIVDQRAAEERSELLGMIDLSTRRRLNLSDESNDPLMRSRTRKQETERVRPLDLLQTGRKAIISGVPGCGKTTLLKYLALKAHEEQRLVLWLELKALGKALLAQAERAAAKNGSIILQELWLKQIASQFSLSKMEIRLWREYWQAQLKANQIAVFLDGFDELQNEIVERSLKKCVRQFVCAAEGQVLLITTRPYAQRKLGTEGLQELKIEPFNERQIEAFLGCYYPNDAATNKLLLVLHERSSLRDLLNVPLLLGVILRLHREDRFTDERLSLYETITTDLVRELDRSKSVDRQFKISDERLRLDFLKFLAFERLLRDALDEKDDAVSWLVFSYDQLKDKAKIFLAQEDASLSARELVNDSLATPLLREVGIDLFAFSHLTLQEYLAAVAFKTFYKSNECGALRMFCRAYLNAVVVELEVLPMIFGLLADPELLYDQLHRLPESLSFAQLRLAAKSLTYTHSIFPARLADLTEKLSEFVIETRIENTPFAESVLSSFGTAREKYQAIIVDSLSVLLENPEPKIRTRVTRALGEFRHQKGLQLLLAALKDPEREVRWVAAIQLGRIGDERAVEGLLNALNDDDVYIRDLVIEALGRIGDERAIPSLVKALGEREHDRGQPAAFSLAIMAGGATYLDERPRRKPSSSLIFESLIKALTDADVEVRYWALFTLGQIDHARSTDGLLIALNDPSGWTRKQALEYLSDRAGARVTSAVLFYLQDAAKEVRDEASDILARKDIHPNAKELGELLKSPDSDVRRRVIKALGKAQYRDNVTLLLPYLSDPEKTVRTSTVEALFNIAGPRAKRELVAALNSRFDDVRITAASCLGKGKDNEFVEPLIDALKDKSIKVRQSAIVALAEISDSQSIDALLSAFTKAQNQEILHYIVWALKKIGGERTISRLLDATESMSSSIRQKTAIQLGAAGGSRGLQIILDAVEVGDGDIRWSAIYALRELDDDKAVAGLLTIVRKETNNTIREEAISALGRMRFNPSIGGAVNDLIEVLDDKSYQVREAAARSLEYIGDERAVNKLCCLLMDQEGDVAYNVRRALSIIGGKRATRALLAIDGKRHPLYDGVPSLLRNRATKVVDDVLPFVSDQDLTVRFNATRVLAKSLGAISTEALRRLSNDQDPEIRDLATSEISRRLESISPDSLRNRNEDVRSLIKDLTQKVEPVKLVPHLLFLLKSTEQFVRQSAAETLMKINNTALTNGLVESFEDEDWFVRQKAAQNAGYYETNPDLLLTLCRLSEEDPRPEVRHMFKQACIQFNYKLEVLGNVSLSTSQVLPDNQSREGVLVGEVTTMVAAAGHLFREVLKYDEGIDGEIEFKGRNGRASGRRVYLQLKSGDSYLRRRKRDGKEIFTAKARHLEYWLSQAYPVLLVIRDSGGRVRWMNVTEYLSRRGTTVRQIEFEGEPFTAQSVKQMQASFAR